MRVLMGVFKFSSTNHEDLEVWPGEILILLQTDSMYQDGWWKGMSVVSKRIGLFPSNHVTENVPVELVRKHQNLLQESLIVLTEMKKRAFVDQSLKGSSSQDSNPNNNANSDGLSSPATTLTPPPLNPIHLQDPYDPLSPTLTQTSFDSEFPLILEDWSCHNVALFLRRDQGGRLPDEIIDILIENEIDGEVILDLDEPTLRKDMNIPEDWIPVIMESISKLRIIVQGDEDYSFGGRDSFC